MRHGHKFNKLGRKKGHRKALLRNLSIALITHKRIKTTLPKAKALRRHLEPILTKAKTNTTHSRRVVFSYMQDNEAMKELFGPIAAKIADRPGGYLRIIRMGFRLGDAAEMAMIEFVDFNEVMLAAKEAKPKRKRTRRGKKKADVVEAVAATAVAEEVVEATVADDLKKIEGIGPKIEEIINKAGVLTFKQLAETPSETIKSWLEAAGSNFASHDPGTWPKQSEMAANGQWDELKTWQDELDGGK